MADIRELQGQGTLSDGEEVELASVAYQLGAKTSADGINDEWGGKLSLPDSTVIVDPGRYVLTLDDGTRVDIDVEPLGSADGDARHLEFTGVGIFGRRVDDI